VNTFVDPENMPSEFTTAKQRKEALKTNSDYTQEDPIMHYMLAKAE